MEKWTWNFINMDHLHVAVNSTIRHIMQNERSKKWSKVIENYKILLFMVSKKNLPEDYEPPPSYNMLLYEIYYHLGVAYQHLKNPRKSAESFTSAISAVSAPKNGCLAGCVTNSCLMTPLYARRAFSFSQIGEHEKALKDAERCVVLDSRNPDLYCIRALVKSTMDKDSSLEEQSIAARGTIPVYQMETDLCRNITTFTHPSILEFYDKYLYPLSVPHTIISINLTPDKPSKKKLECKQLQEYNRSPNANSPNEHEISVQQPPFRCGTPKGTSSDRSSVRRRHDYAKAIQKFMSRPKTASDYFAQLERGMKLKAQKEEIESRRAISAGTCRQQIDLKNLPKTSNLSQSISTIHSPTRTYEQKENLSPSTQPSPSSHNRMSMCSKLQNVFKKPGTATTHKTGTSIATKTSEFVVPTPETYSIPVFQPVNIREAPRMYYKPWKGDKLPVAEIRRKAFTPKFI
ncbi:uncharacterized protein LOC134691081 isoform X4 [Mytilus trossulus]|uniref:uncharacterized protein LOC134691081 isoform X4 n=1 Tax=Mytilus trossulus TaxID=6551 RepID=UPI003006A6CC